MPSAEEREMQPFPPGPSAGACWSHGGSRSQQRCSCLPTPQPSSLLPHPLKGSRALMTSHVLTSNRYVFENRIRPHTSTTTLKGFSPHLLLSVPCTQVGEWHKAPLSPPFSPSSSRQQENLRRAKGKPKKQFWVLSAQGTISISGFCCC